MKTSIVNVVIKCIVQHEDVDDPADILSYANYEIAVEPNPSQEMPKIIWTEMLSAKNLGECHPTEFFLLNK